jgi:glycosyltransferase involved in cell wall biosynthesis
MENEYLSFRISSHTFRYTWRMRIAQIAPIIERVPPKRYGGTERVVWALTEELVKRGHEVTLFASGDSLTSAKLESVYPRALREARLKDLYGLNYFTLLNIGIAYDRQDEFDVIHDHVVPHSLPAANLSRTPVITTMHGPFTGENRRLFQILKKPGVVTISNSQAFPAPGINHLGTVYNGLHLADYPFGNEPEDYLLFVGRISMEKGVHLAIQVAQELDMRLIIAAKLETVDRPYFKEYVEPWLTDRIEWIGEVDEQKRNELMSKALCFLHPVTWREPFGLTLIEAMACGCPVIAMNLGSIPEIIQNGVTGFVVEDIEGMVSAVEGVENIDRRTCRDHALTNFSAEKMAEGYEQMYKKMLQKNESS